MGPGRQKRYFDVLGTILLLLLLTIHCSTKPPVANTTVDNPPTPQSIQDSLPMKFQFSFNPPFLTTSSHLIQGHPAFPYLPISDQKAQSLSVFHHSFIKHGRVTLSFLSLEPKRVIPSQIFCTSYDTTLYTLSYSYTINKKAVHSYFSQITVQIQINPFIRHL